MADKFLRIANLTVQYVTDDGVVKAVNNLSLELDKGETLGLVGETGAGKTTTALAIVNLVPDPPGQILSGQIIFEGQDLLKMPVREIRKIRGKRISMIFQDPMTSLNPIMSIGEQISEVIMIHEHISAADAQAKAIDMLQLVGIQGERYGDYPHQLSGGMKQRIVIALALACTPMLLIADEPTTALDVTIQAQVLELIGELRNQFETSMILITHDLGIVAQVCDKVAIMYAGEIVEYGTLDQVYNDTRHPYTKGLFESIPRLDKGVHRLKPIKGLMPDPTDLPQGCMFAPRCPEVTDACLLMADGIVKVGNGHLVRCIKYGEVKAH